MLEENDILKNISELKFLLMDSNKNILLPQDVNRINEFNNILKCKIDGNIINDSLNKKWYKYYKKVINENNFIYYLYYLIDITELKEDEKKYEIDDLTKVYTRASSLEKICTELINCSKKNIPFSFIMCDIDYFKNINDKYGHIVGDKVLSSIGKIFLNNLTNAIIGRYGGEEFIIFLKNINSNDCLNLIKKIKSDLSKLEIKHEKSIISNITISFGIFQIDKNAQIISHENVNKILFEFIDNADKALYSSKKMGRNQTHIFYNEQTIIKLDD